MMTIGQRLSILRQELKLTQKELADKFNISPSTIGMYEQDRRAPDSDTLNKFADFFNVSTDYLLCRTDVRKQSEPSIETKAYHNLDTSGLSNEDIAYIDALIAGIKAKRKAEREGKK